MNRHHLAGTIAVSMFLLAAVAGCSDSASSSANPTAEADSTTSTPSPVAESSEPAATPLEGEWSASISKEAARATLRRTGFGSAADGIVDATPWGDYRLSIAGDELLLFDPNGEVMDDGTITIEQNHMILVAHEVPGQAVLRFTVNGSTLRFGFVSQNRPAMASGLTDEPFVRMFYTTVPWTHAP